MGEDPSRTDGLDLTTALRELDASKALMHRRQVELSGALPAPADDRCSPNNSHRFRSCARAMNEAEERHRNAVVAFNAACRRKEQPTPKVLRAAAS
jgi:hypothetical protein